ncbi:MAG: copper resistance CopC family protein [Pseudolysinimonas sp.]|uniref:copper resistance CopC family protein n=1 Tax=Pseudolysinimonas sp. TaxID=2680009 RepID=UPI003266DA55
MRTRTVATVFTTTMLTGAVAAVMLFTGAAAPAWAHSVIIASTPTADETLTALPDTFSVTANETLLNLGDQGVFALQIRDAAGRYYGDGCVKVVDATMSATPALGASGTYTVLWQVISADGHPVSGEIPFSWEAPVGFTPAPNYASAPACGEDPASEPSVAPSTSTAPPRDGSSPALWIGIGVAIFGALIAVFIGIAAARTRREPPDSTPPQNPPTI